MTQIRFQTPEYQKDGSFILTDYEFSGDENSGWEIKRNNALTGSLGPGFTPVESLLCGVCSTDLARKFLPYPLPDITGHEVVGLYQGKKVVVEINASHEARGIENDCPYCKGGMNTQCPHRVTLGIDRLPGGFSPVFLAPVHAIQEIPVSIPLETAVMTEPFAAALQAVEASHPVSSDRVAVLGPRRLGALIVAALAGYRKREGLSFEITAIARHEHLLNLSRELGADNLIDLRKQPAETLRENFDIVFDTTSTPEGFADALNMSRRIVHLKSTNGQTVLGMKHLTDMVVEEIALLPLTESSLDFTWPVEEKKRRNPNVYISPSIKYSVLQDLGDTGGRLFHKQDAVEAKRQMQAGENILEGSPFPRFDLAIVSTLAEADQVIRPTPPEEYSILRARGAVLLAPGSADDSLLYRSVTERGIAVHTSRCGDFRRALAILEQSPQIAQAIQKYMITDRYDLPRIQEAFDRAADSRSIKVIVQTGTIQ